MNPDEQAKLEKKIADWESSYNSFMSGAMLSHQTLVARMPSLIFNSDFYPNDESKIEAIASIINESKIYSANLAKARRYLRRIIRLKEKHHAL